jgi:PAS domain S-box-containing protein
LENYRILLVDDEQEISDYIKLKLRLDAPHLDILTVTSGEECLDYIQAGNVDCILSDYQMPGMDGMALLREIRARGLDIPFIFVTGQGSEQVATQAFRAGAWDYFTKDVGFAHFPRIINSIEQAIKNREERGRRKQSEEKYRLLFDSNPNPMMVFDIEANFQILAVNEAACRLYGYTREELQSLTIMDIRPPEDIERAARFIREHPDGPESTGGWKHIKKDGSLIDVNITYQNIDFDGRVARINVINNVTEKKKTESMLQKSEQRYKNLVDLSDDSIYEWDRDGRLTFASDETCKKMETTPEEAIGKPWTDFVHPGDQDKSVRLAQLMIETGTDLKNFENRLVSKTGKVFHMVHNIRLRRDEKGEITGMQGIARNISDIKRAEEEKDAMYHMLTHDIRSPLSVIYGYGGSFVQELSPAELTVMMADIHRAARKINALIDDMLALSRLEGQKVELERQPVELASIVFIALKENKTAAAERDITIVNEVPELPLVHLDTAELVRAVSNLISNAVNYNRTGGKIRIGGGVAEGATPEVFIEVQDTGTGIDESDLPNLFNKYYRGKRVGKKRGTGLGLAIVKAVMDAHGGRVAVETGPSGSTFRLYLPAATGPGTEPGKEILKEQHSGNPGA